MKIGLIAPAWDLVREKKGSRIFLLPPLTFPVLGALTPDDIDIDIVEERVRPIPFDSDYDLVGLTFVTAFAPHTYDIADRFREKGVKVVLGGPHASVLPEEALQHADSVVVGEAEATWGPLIKDFRKGRLQRIYRAPELFDMKKFPRPRLDLVPKEFTFRNATLASKGCPFHCSFCFINSINQYRQRFRPVSEVVKDIELMDGKSPTQKYFCLWDDNIIGNFGYAKDLCRAIAPFKKKWAAAASANVAMDDEMLTLLEKAGCYALFIGLESVNAASLRKSGKTHNRVEKYQEMMRKLHGHGIAVTGAFVFGFDQDDKTVFDRTLEFAMNIDLDCITPAILTPLPATPFYEQMEREGRIVDRNWAHYDYQHVVFEPRQMDRDILYEGFIKLMNDFFSYRSMYKRLSRSRTHLLLVTLLNLGYHNFYRRLLREYQMQTEAERLSQSENSNQSAINQSAPSSCRLSTSGPVCIDHFYSTEPSLNKVQLLVDADEIFPYVYNMISQAEKSIHLEMYLLEGEIGQRVIDLMHRRAKAGVKVRLIYQPPASIKAYNRIMLLFNRLGLKNRAISYITFSGATNNENGIQVAPFPLGLFRRKASVKMAHNKVLIVDSKEAMAGGMNFGSITELNHDIMVVVRGPIVQEMEKVFGHTWQLASGSRIISELQDCNEGQYRKDQSDLAWVSFRITHPQLENTKSFLLQQIKEARKRVLVEMYLFIDSELVSAIIEAAGKGLEVRVLLDANPLPLDFDLHGFPNKRMIQRLMKANVPVRVFCCEPGQEMHMKVALFDDDKIVVGSTNWTKGSFTSNSESCFFIQSEAVQKKFIEIFEKDWKERSEPAQRLTVIEKVVAAGMRILDNVY